MGSDMGTDIVSFNTYRPSYHFISPHSWMNDPCGAAYIPEIKEYILCYQWHPGSVEGGNSAWGMARSKDLIKWVDCFPALRNGTPPAYDSHGVFSGSLVSRLVNNRRVIYLYYTSISALPIHWSKPYIPGCESQSLAYSTDFGHSWHRYQHNPLLTQPRHNSSTTGWRDPFVNTWPSLSTLRGVRSSTNYMLMSSGKRDRGPELVLYESADMLTWAPLCVLFKARSQAPITHHASSPLRHGMNFECGSFFTLDGKEYIIAGVELHPSQTTRHSTRFVLWMCGSLRRSSKGKPIFVPESHGVLDHGILYGPHVFRGSKNEVLLSGWADEDLDANPAVKSAQGWAGCVTLPRELFVLSRPITPDDPTAVDSHLWSRDEAAGTMTTLGIRPARQLRGLRSGSMVYSLDALRNLRSKAYEIEARFRGLAGHETLTFNVRQSPANEEVTRIIFSLSTSAVTVDRSASSLAHGHLAPDEGPFRLLDGEDLHIRVFVDNSIIEVYANSRFALTSRVYPTRADSLGASCEFVGLEGEGEGVAAAGAGNGTAPASGVWMQVWEGLVGAWPERGREEFELDGRMEGMDIEDDGEYEDAEADADASTDVGADTDSGFDYEVYGAGNAGEMKADVEMGKDGLGPVAVAVEARDVGMRVVAV